MAVLFATLGFTAKLALAPLKDHPDITEVRLFYGAPMRPEGKTALQAARATLETLDVALHEHQVRNAFDYEQILAVFSRAWAHCADAKIIINASGGTRVMTMAATIFAFTNDVPMVYYDEYETIEGKEIPLKAFRQLRDLGKSQRQILQYIRFNGMTNMGTLANELGLAPSTLSVHVHRLMEAGVLHVTREGKRRMVDADTVILAMESAVPA